MSDPEVPPSPRGGSDPARHGWSCETSLPESRYQEDSFKENSLTSHTLDRLATRRAA